MTIEQRYDAFVVALVVRAEDDVGAVLELAGGGLVPGLAVGGGEDGGEVAVRVMCDLSLHVMVGFQNMCFQQTHVK